MVTVGEGRGRQPEDEETGRAHLDYFDRVAGRLVTLAEVVLDTPFVSEIGHLRRGKRSRNAISGGLLMVTKSLAL